MRGVVRGLIGYDGLVMSDDLSMKALSGSFSERAASAIKAGCDVVLHCNGDMAEMKAIASATPPLAGTARRRARRPRSPASGMRRSRWMLWKAGPDPGSSACDADLTDADSARNRGAIRRNGQRVY